MTPEISNGCKDLFVIFKGDAKGFYKLARKFNENYMPSDAPLNDDAGWISKNGIYGTFPWLYFNITRSGGYKMCGLKHHTKFDYVYKPLRVKL